MLENQNRLLSAHAPNVSLLLPHTRLGLFHLRSARNVSLLLPHARLGLFHLRSARQDAQAWLASGTTAFDV
jgi:hypothetical protein